MKWGHLRNLTPSLTFHTLGDSGCGWQYNIVINTTVTPWPLLHQDTDLYPWHLTVGQYFTHVSTPIIVWTANTRGKLWQPRKATERGKSCVNWLNESPWYTAYSWKYDYFIQSLLTRSLTQVSIIVKYAFTFLLTWTPIVQIYQHLTISLTQVTVKHSIQANQ